MNKEQKYDLNYYHWFYEPNSVSVKIKPKFRKQIFEISLDKAKTMTNLSKITNLSKQTLFNYMYGKCMNIKGLKTLLQFVNISFKEANVNITEVGWNKIKFPVKLDTNESAVLFSAIMGDGANSETIMYKNKDANLISKVKNSTKKWIGNVTIGHQTSDKDIPFITFPRIFGRILNYVGIPSGKQMKFNPGIPEVVKNSKKETKRMFIQQFFDDEGWPEPNQMKVAISQCVDATKYLPKKFINKIKRLETIYIKDIPIDIKSKIIEPKILTDIHDILKNEFNIYSNIRFKRLLIRKKHITGAFELEIQRKDDVKKFIEKINFFSSIKKKKAEYMINRSRNFPQNITLLIINEAIKISKEKKYFFAYELAKNLKYPQAPIRKRLSTLVKKGIFEKEREKYFINIKY
jgi:hypothetical protein